MTCLALRSRIFSKNQLEALGFDVTSSYLAGYGHYSEMEAIAHIDEIDETPTALIVDWIEGILQERVYLPLVKCYSTLCPEDCSVGGKRATLA
jgi:hypothetical protein